MNHKLKQIDFNLNMSLAIVFCLIFITSTGHTQDTDYLDVTKTFFINRGYNDVNPKIVALPDSMSKTSWNIAGYTMKTTMLLNGVDAPEIFSKDYKTQTPPISLIFDSSNDLTVLSRQPDYDGIDLKFKEVVSSTKFTTYEKAIHFRTSFQMDAWMDDSYEYNYRCLLIQPKKNSAPALTCKTMSTMQEGNLTRPVEDYYIFLRDDQ